MITSFNWYISRWRSRRDLNSQETCLEGRSHTIRRLLHKGVERFWRSRLREHCPRTLRGIANLSFEFTNWNNGSLAGIIWNRYFQDQNSHHYPYNFNSWERPSFEEKHQTIPSPVIPFCHPLTQFWYTSYLDDVSCLHIPLERWHLCSIETAVISIGRRRCSLALASIGNTMMARPRRVS